MKKKEQKKLTKIIILVAAMLAIAGLEYYGIDIVGSTENFLQSQTSIIHENSFNLEDIPEFDGKNPYVIVNNNIPNFEEKDFTTRSFEKYSDLDELGRCGVAFANISVDIMPTEKRGKIGMIKPSGWQISKYEFIDGKYLYNRCHLIGYQLSGENANEKNLITGTRYLNVDGMLPFENEVAEYVKKTKKHVLYRVTPIFKENNLIANGVQMEAQSVEDNGEGIKFNVYVYNNQPNVKIDYLTGRNSLVE